jgi:hypothetical protein
MLAVVGDPLGQRALQCHGAEDREHELHRLNRLEGAVGEEPV